MKRFIAFLAILLILTSVLSAPVFAAYGKGDTVEIDVHGTMISSEKENVVSSSDKGNGSYTVKNGGVKVTVKSPEQKDMTLVVRFVDETDTGAYEWFLLCADEYGTDPTVFDIYFLNEKGERIELDGDAEIELVLDKTYTRLKLLVIDREGNVTELDREINGMTISFDASREGYYVIIEGKPDPSTPPATGDVAILLFVTLAISSSIVMVIVAGKRKARTE